MVEFHRCPNIQEIRDLKERYLLTLVAPMDGMWEAGFADAADHWEIRVDGRRAGFFALTEEGRLLQFYLLPEYVSETADIFQTLISRDDVRGAMVSTVDPLFLSMCLENYRTMHVHTIQYEIEMGGVAAEFDDTAPDFRLLELRELDRAVEFEVGCLDLKGDVVEWLRGYTGNLIRRGQLFVLVHNDEWIGIGELRRSDTQKGITDLGVMVDPAFRRNGWATHILRRMTAICADERQRAICSTTVENVGAQRAITRAGFTSRHRLLKVTF